MGSSDLRNIVLIDLDTEGNARIKALTDNKTLEYAPSWSPDGTIVTSIIQGARGNFNLQSIDVETGKVIATTNFDFGFINAQANPNWLPDGSALLFSSLDSGMGRAKRAQGYNSSRSNKPRPIIDVDTDVTDYTVLYASLSPVIAW